MTWRSFAIRVPLIVCLLFGTSAFAKKKPPGQPVNINAATSEELQLVPGIGPSTAEKILQMRKSYGPFKSVDDLLATARKYLDSANMQIVVVGDRAQIGEQAALFGEVEIYDGQGARLS